MKLFSQTIPLLAIKGKNCIGEEMIRGVYNQILIMVNFKNTMMIHIFLEMTTHSSSGMSIAGALSRCFMESMRANFHCSLPTCQQPRQNVTTGIIWKEGRKDMRHTVIHEECVHHSPTSPQSLHSTRFSSCPSSVSSPHSLLSSRPNSASFLLEMISAGNDE